jgi:hypothetical protein
MSTLLISLVPISGILVAEMFIFRSNLPFLYEKSTQLPFLEKAYGLVIFFNVVVSTFVILIIGFKVSAARSKCKEMAKKDGNDPDYEDSKH